MRIILIGNYPPDGQESMERFAQMLDAGLRNAGAATEIWRPVPVFGARVGATNAGYRKWLGYLDKWMIFPLVLRWRQRRPALQESNVRFHVCDHSNAPYLAHLDPQRASITCHDVLAIRGGLGYADAHVVASRLGQTLQKWIFRHLSQARRLASVSQFTLRQLVELTGAGPLAGWRVIHNAFNADFEPLSPVAREAVLHRAGLSFPAPFLLHVGSGLPRKNRSLLLDMVHALGNRWVGTICFAGEPLDEALLAHAGALGLRGRVASVVKPDHTTLVALYSACEAFVFPSLSEGFGWPIIEAQACGAPVIASNIEPMPEVSGGAALHADPTDASAFAAALLALQQPGARDALVQQGFANCRRFETTYMVRAYLNLYGLVPA
ncbi:glycosyltransferase [Hymenobacter caeli]|uniref:Glycosyltransferase involved in cell wall biosynthesis n=1 Tax=Hymenobacter caeli TaxID=2735894 RepID=A0ABX2FNZ5_9BACT|nr:glycosyltransferase [Hymenobacter caeli]NRT18682.1 glycosyltransferase involved in cell wall biosynthesis [Hymenobacter caeli]